jgi:hypothetical protein
MKKTGTFVPLRINDIVCWTLTYCHVSQLTLALTLPIPLEILKKCQILAKKLYEKYHSVYRLHICSNASKSIHEFF